MATSRTRLAPVQDLVLVFASCSVPIYSWSVLMFFERLPGWLYHLDSWEVTGIFAYGQVFALLESGVALFALVLLGAVLPARWMRDRFATRGSAAMLLASAWAVVGHMTGETPYSPFAPWNVRAFPVGVALYLAVLGAFCALMARYPRLERGMRSFAKRLTVLMYLYAAMTLPSALVIVLRNIQRRV